MHMQSINVSFMAKAAKRSRPSRMTTIDPGIVKEALAMAKKERPPVTTLSRLIDLALVEWIDKRKK